MRGRLLLACIMLVLSCGPKQAENEVLSQYEGPSGVWHFMDSEAGPVVGTFEFDGTNGVLTDLKGRESTFSSSKMEFGLELRGDLGEVIIGRRTGSGGMIFYVANGGYALAKRAIKLKDRWSGSWVLRDPMKPSGHELVIHPAVDGLWGTATTSNHTFLISGFVDASQRGLVLRNDGELDKAKTRVWHLRPIGPETFLVTGPEPSRFRILGRKGRLPAWVGADTGAKPDGLDAFLPPG